ncbi:MAG: hypothetical protein DI547_05935 [Sphingobium sp.]|nr:MAG: hypothetical protein DI547_05935 [Sphingobium sp.]
MGVRLSEHTAYVIALCNSASVQRAQGLRLNIMGFSTLLTRILLSGAATALAILSPARAQENGTPQTQPQNGGVLQGFQLDPGRDTSKPAAPEREGPEIGTPLPSTPFDVPVQQRSAAQPQQPAAGSPQAAPAIVTPPPIPRAAPATTSRPATAPIPAAAPASPTERSIAPIQSETAAPSENAAAPTAIDALPGLTQAPFDNAATPSTDTGSTTLPAATTETTDDGTDWLPWLAGIGGAAVLIGGGIAFRRRRRPRALLAPVVEIEIEPAPLPEVAATTPATPPASPPVPAAPELPRPSAALSMTFAPQGARHTLVGVAVGYRLVLRNDSEVMAENVSVSLQIANASSAQEQRLAAFFAAPTNDPAHQIAQIAPGESIELTGEARVSNDAIEPILMQDRSLLIPVLAFSAHYGWDGGGQGYSGAAFVIGLENDPPGERMAPFRLDQGPKQYREVGSRRAHTAVVT